MNQRHWDGITAYRQPKNKVTLAFVEGLNHKITVIQRRAYGLRDEEYLAPNVLTSILPQIRTEIDHPLPTRFHDDPINSAGY